MKIISSLSVENIYKNKPLSSSENKYYIIPKAGSNLFKKILELAGFERSTINGRPHFYLSPKEPKFNLNDRNILQVRDPRDTMISLAFYLDKLMDRKLNHTLIQKKQFPTRSITISDAHSWKALSIDEKIMCVLKGGKAFGYDFDWAVSKQWEVALKFYQKLRSQNKKFLLIKFEDLIGANGGGADEVQKATLLKLFNFMKVKCSKSTLEKIQRNYWGNTCTFHKGQIGKWKNYFKPEHTKEFLNKFQIYLEGFGYESNTDWALPYLT